MLSLCAVCKILFASITIFSIHCIVQATLAALVSIEDQRLKHDPSASFQKGTNG